MAGIAGGLLLLLPTLAATVSACLGQEASVISVASMLVKLVMFAGIFLLLRSWPQNPAELLVQAENFIDSKNW